MHPSPSASRATGSPRGTPAATAGGPLVSPDADGRPQRIDTTAGRRRLALVRTAVEVRDPRCPTARWRVEVDHGVHAAEFRASLHDDVETLIHLGAYVAGVWA